MANYQELSWVTPLQMANYLELFWITPLQMASYQELSWDKKSSKNIGSQTRAYKGEKGMNLHACLEKLNSWL
jgi:hypothetical protein